MGFWKARLAAGLTAEKVSKILQVSQTTVFEWESGKYMPSAKRLMQIATLYNCPVEELLTPDRKPKGRKLKRDDSDGGKADTSADPPG